jgi:hypothetical protein
MVITSLAADQLAMPSFLILAVAFSFTHQLPPIGMVMVSGSAASFVLARQMVPSKN